MWVCLLSFVITSLGNVIIFRDAWARSSGLLLLSGSLSCRGGSGAFLKIQRALPIAHAGGHGRIYTVLCGLPCVIGFPVYAQRSLLDQIHIRDMALAKIPEQSLSETGTDQAWGFGLTQTDPVRGELVLRKMFNISIKYKIEKCQTQGEPPAQSLRYTHASGWQKFVSAD